MNIFVKTGAVMLMCLATALADDGGPLGGATNNGAPAVPPVLDKGIQVDGVAAYANAHVITYSDALSASRELQQMVSQHRTGEDVNTLYRRVLDDLINRKLILDEYENQKEIKIPDGAIDDRVGSVIREMFKDDRTAFLKALAEEGQSEDAWRAQIREQMVVSAMRNLRVDNQVRVSPLAVRERYDRDPSLFAEPAKVKFSMIVISKGESDEARETQKNKLDEALAALTAGSDFADVARRFSEDAMAKNGGARDWVEPDMLRQELQDVVMSAVPGTVSEIIKIGPNYSLIKVEERRVATRVPFGDAYANVEREMSQELSQKIYDDWIARLRHDSFVKILNEKPF